MGELHLDIVKDRILKEYGVDVYLGPLQIAYKETINKSGRASHTLKKTIGENESLFANPIFADSSDVQLAGIFSERCAISEGGNEASLFLQASAHMRLLCRCLFALDLAPEYSAASSLRCRGRRSALCTSFQEPNSRLSTAALSLLSAAVSTQTKKHNRSPLRRFDLLVPYTLQHLPAKAGSLAWQSDRPPSR